MEFNRIDDIIEDIRQGRMVILVDDEDRENEGDLVMAAAHVRAEDINFMATHARGLICLTLTEERCRQLNLKRMVDANGSSLGTNFTVSIEAAEGVTTGISAQDRAHTVHIAVAPQASPRDIVQPGHVFPLMAQPGGVLSRAGHTEAGCDLARLAGLEPAAVIVEIMNEDGTMARRNDLDRFAARHNLKIGSIEQLIQHRLATETTVQLTKTREVTTLYGPFELRTYLDTARHQFHHAMVKGIVATDEPCLTRVHVPGALRDLLCLVEPEPQPFRRWTVQGAMAHIARRGRGALIILGTDTISSDTIERQLDQAFNSSHRPPRARNAAVVQIGVGAQIIRDLGIRKMHLMGGPVKYTGIAGFDLEVVDYVTPEGPS
jgi:3,4-dihydroxy 2-butanone 4-phosphate synthase/GTP cyclohydrolase II